MHHLPKQIAAVTAALALAAAAASCGSSSSSSSNASSSGGGAVPQVDVTKFTADYAVMKTLQSLAAQGKHTLNRFRESWTEFRDSVETILNRGAKQ